MLRIVSLIFFLMIRRPPRSTLDRSSAASDVYKRQDCFQQVDGVAGEPGDRLGQDQVDLSGAGLGEHGFCLLYTSPSPRDRTRSRMPSSA
mgnify:CR=1 FL=1